MKITHVEGIKIRMPIPPRTLSPNGRPHHMAKAKDKKIQREAACAQCLIALDGTPAPQWKLAHVYVYFYAKDRRGVQDGDNILASLKSAFDGIADAGIVSNDRNFVYWPIDRNIDKANPRVEITITGEAL